MAELSDLRSGTQVSAWFLKRGTCLAFAPGGIVLVGYGSGQRRAFHVHDLSVIDDSAARAAAGVRRAARVLRRAAAAARAKNPTR